MRSARSSRASTTWARAWEQSAPPPTTQASRAAALLKALANEQRLMILCTLVGGPLSVGELNERVSLSQSALSQHLAVLREANIVATTRESQSIRYALPAGSATDIINLLHREFCER